MGDEQYKAAYERQKKARELAENLLEDKSRELYDANQNLLRAYTELKEQKATILHQEKLASIGQLAAGVAHEINNPTAYIKSNLGTLRKYAQDFRGAFGAYQDIGRGFSEKESINVAKDYDLEFIMDDLDDLIKDCLDGVRHIEEIVGGLKFFARPDEKKKTTLDINDVIHRSLKLVSSDLKHKAEVILELGEVPKIVGHPGELGQVVLNLLLNASQAISGAGIIRLTTRTENNDLMIEVQDNGCGMDQETANKIFDPFFTTKDVGSGTGLGLSVSLGIIQRHGGEVIVESEAGAGTTFKIALPAVGTSEVCWLSARGE